MTNPSRDRVLHSIKNSALRKKAYHEARQAGLDTNTSQAVAQRVLDRIRPFVDIDEIIREEITKHAQP